MEAQTQAHEGGSAEAPVAQTYPVIMTQKAVEMVSTTRSQEGIDEGSGLRVAVRGGGCSGFEYALDFENEVRDTDLVYDQHGLRLIVDPVTVNEPRL